MNRKLTQWTSDLADIRKELIKSKYKKLISEAIYEVHLLGQVRTMTHKRLLKALQPYFEKRRKPKQDVK